jgi:hypothetical protein
MNKRNYFNDGLFKSAKGEVIEVKLANGILNSRFSNETEFTELIACEEGWWFGYPDYSIKPAGNDILLSKGITIGLSPELFQRI